MHHSVHFIRAPIFRLLLKVAVNGTHQCDFLNFCGGLGSQHAIRATRALDRIPCVIPQNCKPRARSVTLQSHWLQPTDADLVRFSLWAIILAEGAIALSVTLSGGALFAS